MKVKVLPFILFFFIPGFQLQAQDVDSLKRYSMYYDISIGMAYNAGISLGMYRRINMDYSLGLGISGKVGYNDYNHVSLQGRIKKDFKKYKLQFVPSMLVQREGVNGFGLEISAVQNDMAGLFVRYDRIHRNKRHIGPVTNTHYTVGMVFEGKMGRKILKYGSVAALLYGLLASYAISKSQ